MSSRPTARPRSRAGHIIRLVSALLVLISIAACGLFKSFDDFDLSDPRPSDAGTLLDGGGFFKVTTDPKDDISLRVGQTIDVRVTIERTPGFTEAVNLEQPSTSAPGVEVELLRDVDAGAATTTTTTTTTTTLARIRGAAIGKLVVTFAARATPSNTQSNAFLNVDVTNEPSLSLDSTFGDGGIVATQLSPGELRALFLDTKENAVVGFVNSERVSLARFNSTNGALDSTVGDGGLATTTSGFFTAFGFDRADRALVSNVTLNVGVGGSTLGVVRFDSSLKLEPAFRRAIDGFQAEGFILLNGGYGVPSSNDAKGVRLVRLADDAVGTPTGGFTTDPRPASWANALYRCGREDAPSASGRILLGVASGGAAQSPAIIRLLATSGAPDQSFAPGGIALAAGWPTTGNVRAALACVVVDESTVVFVGTDFVARMRGTSLDPTFGDGGVVALDLPLTASDPNADPIGIAIDKLGGVLVVGIQGAADKREVVIQRLTPAGALDLSFRDSQHRTGFVVPLPNARAPHLAVRSSDQKIILGVQSGTSQSPSAPFFLIRLATNLR